MSLPPVSGRLCVGRLQHLLVWLAFSLYMVVLLMVPFMPDWLASPSSGSSPAEAELRPENKSHSALADLPEPLSFPTEMLQLQHAKALQPALSTDASSGPVQASSLVREGRRGQPGTRSCRCSTLIAGLLSYGFLQMRWRGAVLISL
eukprot:gnl/TRDRNA2_/TRDRNA2_178264_c0_seq1.p1 gnl/TRDRNA2_/TRDRNA2_178264_c0~~gnl/TRDRNA2_/TRDRNA2_178264_c0_seq1.p1  ORF type:complete len:147 (+),score=21.15 gnl/TRDRNA2_/TRDRNA2_178264_c0_seq1:69-509(+)